MSIRVLCPCGHHFRAKEKYAGKQGKCPGCGEMVLVPGEETPAPPAPDRKPAPRSPTAERRHLMRTLARHLTPRTWPETAGLGVAGATVPAREPGRDYADCVQLHDGAWAVAVATVNARGIDAVQSACQLRAATRALAMGYSDPGAILSLLNRTFAVDWPEGRSATMLLVRWDPAVRMLTYASAGHPTGYVLDARGNSRWNLESSDCALGLLAHTIYVTSPPLRLESGESLLLMTSGVLNVSVPGGVPRLLQAAGSASHPSAQASLEALRQLLPREHPPQADQTLLLARVL